ncbi:MAG: aminoglycoside phosphotransferase family protein [Acidimicrobiia bacterium]
MVRPTWPTGDQIERLSSLLGGVGAFRAVSGGFSAAGLWIVETPSGTVFVKVAVNEDTARWLRDEARIYQGVAGPFMPRLVCFDDEGDRPLLVVEDLSHHRRPPPWTSPDADAVLASLEAMWATPVPPDLPPADDGLFTLWDEIATDPAPVLVSGQLTLEWLDAWVPAMQHAAAQATPEGSALIHQDIRSDNLAIGPDGIARFFDWNWAAVGNAQLDLAAWLPSLAMEGGPKPWEVMIDGGPYAAVLAGYFIWAAAQPLVAEVAPHIRAFQRAQGEVALQWACRELGIPPK